MEFCNPTLETYTCAMCGEYKNTVSYIAPSGIHCGEKICKSCYEREFGDITIRKESKITDRDDMDDNDDFATCSRCNRRFPRSTTSIIYESRGDRYCGQCFAIMASGRSYRGDDPKPELCDLVAAVYTLNDSVKELTAILKSKL